MASSSSSTVMASPNAIASSYDVFLSFRGEDTRHSFTDHLYHKLVQSGISAFRDEEEISRDVRKHKGSFGVEKDRWKTALTEVANLSGFTISGPETTTLKDVVDTIYNRLDQKEVYLPVNIVGMASRYNEVSSWFDQGSVGFLAIYGMGGSGKTTLAKYIYNLHRRSFEYVSFVEDIGSRCKAYNDLLELQKQLLKDIVGGKKRKIPSISQGMCMIEYALKMNRTLIVLDDIVERSQLVSLLGTGKINPQSKIIITTRENIDNWFDFPYWRCQKYEMRLLNDDESLELFCRHAFQSEIHHEGYDEVVKYCEGNPLALELLGSSTQKYNADMIMPSQLRLFEIDMDSRIQSVLIRSYLSLPCNIVKELFLHIACFFIGIDIDYVVKILEPDYAARSGVETLLVKCLISVSPNRKIMMHRLLQEMAKNIVRQESTKFPAKRSRVWLSSDSYKILSKGKGSKTIEGLALDMKILQKEDFAVKSSELKTDPLKNMEILKLLQLNFAELTGSYEYVSENLRWLCWHGFHLRTIPSELYIGNLVAIDMSYSNLEVFEPPTVLQSLKILNLKDSHNLFEIRNIFNIPCLETLVLWNCSSLVKVCKSIGDLTSLAIINMTGCKNLFNREQINMVATSTSVGVVTKQPSFSFPSSLHQLFLKDCNLECAKYFPLSFIIQPYLQYLNLCNSLFEFLPCYHHLQNLRVLDLSFCSRLKCLLGLPSTLAELYVYYCESLEKITFQSHQFPLQEFGYRGCVNLCEIEGYVKLVPIAKLDKTDLGHMEWLKDYQNHEVYLVGDDELTIGRSCHIQMLYEFNIMSTSLPNINDTNMTPKYISESSSLSFDIPSCPKSKRLKGINVTFKYSISGDDWAWFCKVSTTNGVVDLIYNPKVFGKPEFGEICIWLSYWPSGNLLDFGDTVHVSIVVMSGLEVHECGVSFVYSDKETLENNMGGVEILGENMPGFQLSTGAYYLCRKDFFELMEVGRLTPDWFRVLAGETIDYTEVRGWGISGRTKQMTSSFTELKTISCIIHGPQWEDIYNVTEMSTSTMAFKSSMLEGEMKSGIRNELIYETTEGSSGISHQQALAQVTRQAAQVHTQLPQIHSFNSKATTYQRLPPAIPDHNITHDMSNLPPAAVDKPDDDGYNWRKYGQKQVKGSEYPRSYYKCTHPNCPMKKQIERSVEGLVTEIVYKGQHNHQPPQSKRGKDTGNGGSSQYEQGSEGQTSNFSHSRDRRSMHSYENSGSSDSDEVGDDVSRVDERHEDEPQAKRRNTEVRGSDPVASHRAEPRIIVQTTSDIDFIDDGYRWQKYGQKVLKGNPFPRSYFKCTHRGCNVRKHVERAASDPKDVITTYEGKHTHDMPAAKNSSHNLAATTSTQLQPPIGAHSLIQRPEYPNQQQPPQSYNLKKGK